MSLDGGAIEPFVPKLALTAERNRAKFIEFCRAKATTLGIGLDFDSPTWDVSDYFSRGAERMHRVFLNFTSCRRFRKAKSSSGLGKPMGENLALFAKAYTIYCSTLAQWSLPPKRFILLFRLLEIALHEQGRKIDVADIDASTLNHAVIVAGRRLAKQSIGSFCGNLHELCTFLRDNGLSDKMPPDWRHGVQTGKRLSQRIGPEAEANREERLPSRAAIDAIPVAFNTATEARDVIMTSIMAILCCAPDRISEVFALAADCEVDETIDGKKVYGLRWRGSKGHHDFLKPILHVMEDTARRSIARLKKHTDQARIIAEWYENNPGMLYLPPGFERFRGQDLSANEIADITGMSNSDSVGAWARNRKLRPSGTRVLSSGRTAATYTFSTVERAILALLPPGFPILDTKSGLRYSQALLVIRRYEFGFPKYRPWRCMISPLGYSQVRNAFAFDGEASVFMRLGLSTADQPVGLSSHQLRHHLNTIAQKTNVSQLDVAAWSGRKDIRHNDAYDHETGEEMLERQRAMNKRVAKIRAERDGLDADAVTHFNMPVTRSEVLARGEHGHATEIGFCRHDFASAPCPMFMDCLHCTKHVCIKVRNPEQVEKMRVTLEVARSSAAKAREGAAESYEGAAEWLQAHEESIQRLEQLLALLTDPDVADGTTIVLAKSGRYTLVEQTLQDRGLVDGRELPKPNGTRLISARGWDAI